MAVVVVSDEVKEAAVESASVLLAPSCTSVDVAEADRSIADAASLSVEEGTSAVDDGAWSPPELVTMLMPLVDDGRSSEDSETVSLDIPAVEVVSSDDVVADVSGTSAVVVGSGSVELDVGLSDAEISGSSDTSGVAEAVLTGSLSVVNEARFDSLVTVVGTPSDVVLASSGSAVDVDTSDEEISNDVEIVDSVSKLCVTDSEVEGEVSVEESLAEEVSVSAVVSVATGEAVLDSVSKVVISDSDEA